MACLLPPETATIVFAHTPTGAVPASYWWIDGRFTLPEDARFALMPALRVVYVPILGNSTFVAYDVGILQGLAGLADVGREEFLELTGRVADKSERDELVVRLRKVLEIREAVQRLLRLNTPRDAIGLVRSMSSSAFESKSGANAERKESGVSLSSWIANATRVQDIINVAVIGIAFVVMFTTTTKLSAMGIVAKVVNCIGNSMYGTRDALGFVIASALKYGTVLLGSFYPRIASVIASNRTLGCAVSIALSALSVSSGLTGLTGLGSSGLGSSGLTGLGSSVLGSYASTVSYATTETTIGCFGEIAETMRARQTGEIIASVVLILANIAAGNFASVSLSADAFERLVVARFGTCLVPKTMLSALLALARAQSDLSRMFTAYLDTMSSMGSITHRFAVCLIPVAVSHFGVSRPFPWFPRIKKSAAGKRKTTPPTPHPKKQKAKKKRKEKNH